MEDARGARRERGRGHRAGGGGAGAPGRVDLGAVLVRCLAADHVLPRCRRLAGAVARRSHADVPARIEHVQRSGRGLRQDAAGRRAGGADARRTAQDEPRLLCRWRPDRLHPTGRRRRLGHLGGASARGRAANVARERVGTHLDRSRPRAVLRDRDRNPHGPGHGRARSRRVAADLFPARCAGHGTSIFVSARRQVDPCSRDGDRRLAALPAPAVRWLELGTARRTRWPMHARGVVARRQVDVLLFERGRSVSALAPALPRRRGGVRAVRHYRRATRGRGARYHTRWRLRPDLGRRTAELGDGDGRRRGAPDRRRGLRLPRRHRPLRLLASVLERRRPPLLSTAPARISPHARRRRVHRRAVVGGSGERAKGTAPAGPRGLRLRRGAGRLGGHGGGPRAGRQAGSVVGTARPATRAAPPRPRCRVESVVRTRGRGLLSQRGPGGRDFVFVWTASDRRLARPAIPPSRSWSPSLRTESG